MGFGFRSAEINLDKCYEASLFSCGYIENIIVVLETLIKLANLLATAKGFGGCWFGGGGGGCLRIRLLQIQNQICNDLTCHIDLKTHQQLV